MEMAHEWLSRMKEVSRLGWLSEWVSTERDIRPGSFFSRVSHAAHGHSAGWFDVVPSAIVTGHSAKPGFLIRSYQVDLRISTQMVGKKLLKVIYTLINKKIGDTNQDQEEVPEVMYFALKRIIIASCLSENGGFCRATDNMSLQKARVFEDTLDDKTSLQGLECTKFMQIYRSREVGQSYITSVWTTLLALCHALWLMVKIRPQVILCNGPGTCIPICAIAFIFKV
ncbi:hypothetical protein E3N88_23798 [Mikania micrantha]|uniref:UDP-N-acetylglucosamine transferase subunit ALG14 n=1 Tax=Mikania micrantha TaxID=192012 RepID=A0A5N6NGB8_9ASTR|nr:hypothetical protein E3N88_23798 [Mikania micrantha]